MRLRASSRGATSFSANGFYATIAAGSLGLAMTAPITALYAKALGASDAQAALVVSAMVGSFLTVDLFGSRVVPRVDARAALVIGYCVFGVGSLASAIAPNLAIMTAARVLQGFAAALPMGVGFHMSLRLAERGREGREIARFNACSFAGMSVGPLIVGAVAGVAGGTTGMRWGFAVCGAVNFATAALAALVLPAIPSELRPSLGLPHRSVFAGWRNRRVLAAAGMGFGLRGACSMTLIPLLGHHLGTGAGGVAAATTFLSVSELGGIVASGRLADSHGRAPVVGGAAILSTFVLVVALYTDGFVAYLALSAALGFVMAALRVVPAAMILDLSESKEAAAVGWRLSCDVSSLAAAAGLSTLLRAAGLDGGFLFAAGAAGVVGVLAASVGDTRRPLAEVGREPVEGPSLVVVPGAQARLAGPA